MHQRRACHCSACHENRDACEHAYRYWNASRVRAFRRDGCPALGQRGTISQAIPNDIDPNVNTTIPWELQASLQRAHDDFWRAHYPPHGEIPPDIVGKPRILLLRFGCISLKTFYVSVHIIKNTFTYGCTSSKTHLDLGAHH